MKKIIAVFVLMCAAACCAQDFNGLYAPLDGNNVGPQGWTGTNQFFQGVQLGPIFFNQLSTLGASNFTIVGVTDGVAGSNPCIGGGGGAVAQLINGVWNCGTFSDVLLANQFPGATFDAQVKACITAVIALGGGICDATGLAGQQQILSEIDVGTEAMSGITGNQISVTLLVSPYLNASVNFTSAGACGIKVFSESRVIGTQMGTTHSALIAGAASASMGSILCTDYTSGTGQYAATQGLTILNGAGGTFTNGLVYIKNTFDASSFRDMVIAENGNGSLLHIQATCCATLFQNTTLDCNFIAGCIPLQVDSLQGDLQPVLGTIFVGLSATHAGAGKSNIQITNSLLSATTPCTFTVYSLYMEGNNTDTTTPLVNVDSCQSTQFNGVTAQFRSTSSTAVAFNVTHASVAGIVPSLTVTNFQYQNSPLAFPYPAILDNTSGAVSPSVFTDNQGILASYIGGQNVATNLTFPEIGVPIGTANFDVCRGTSSHTLMCSLNGATAKALSQTIAAGTSAMATGSLGGGVCAAAVTTAAANVATTDAITWSFNAAPGTGYGSASGSGLHIQSYPTSGNVNFVVCNPTAGAIVPAAATLNWRVTR